MPRLLLPVLERERQSEQGYGGVSNSPHSPSKMALPVPRVNPTTHIRPFSVSYPPHHEHGRHIHTGLGTSVAWLNSHGSLTNIWLAEIRLSPRPPSKSPAKIFESLCGSRTPKTKSLICEWTRTTSSTPQILHSQLIMFKRDGSNDDVTTAAQLAVVGFCCGVDTARWEALSWRLGQPRLPLHVLPASSESTPAQWRAQHAHIVSVTNETSE